MAEPSSANFCKHMQVDSLRNSLSRQLHSIMVEIINVIFGIGLQIDMGYYAAKLQPNHSCP